MAFKEVVGILRKTLISYQSINSSLFAGISRTCQSPSLVKCTSTRAYVHDRGASSSAVNPVRVPGGNPMRPVCMRASSLPVVKDTSLHEPGSRGYASKAKYMKRKKAPVDRFGNLKPSQPQLGFEKVKALADVDENVKKIFSLEFASGNDLHRMRRKLSEDIVRDGVDGRDDLAVNIARITEHIRALAPHVENNKKDKFNKVRLLEAIDRRKKMLNYLRKRNYPRFLQILEELDLSFTQRPMYNFRKTRRSMEKDAVCREAFEQRREALMEFEKRKREEELLEIARLKEELGMELGDEEKEMLERSREGSSV